MNAGDTVFVIGAGGAVVKMDVPGDVHRRERFDADLAKGALRLVDADDVDEVPHPRWPDATRFVLRTGATPTAPAPATEAGPGDEPAADSQPPPADDPLGVPLKSANKATWVDFAVSQGMDADAAKAMTKPDLVEQFGG